MVIAILNMLSNLLMLQIISWVFSKFKKFPGTLDFSLRELLLFQQWEVHNATMVIVQISLY